MAKRNSNVKVESISYEHHYLSVYADAHHKRDIADIEGVTWVHSPNENEASCMVFYDARYNPREIRSEIEALNTETDVPDAFK